MIITHEFRRMSGASVEQIEETVAHRVKSVKVEKLDDFNNYLMTIDLDENSAFHIGKLIGHYELGINHGLIQPRKIKIYGKEYKKDYPLVSSKSID